MITSSTESLKTFTEVELNIGLNLIRQVPASVQAVVSPLSVILTLAMVQAGARGQTRSQIHKIISYGANNTDVEGFYSRLSQEVLNVTNGVQTRIANALYIDKGYIIEKQYEAAIKEKFSAVVKSLDFRKAADTAEVIDKFISDTTEGKIRNIVNEQMVMGASSLIVNAVNFEAMWLEKFEKDLTQNATFHCSQASQKEIEFMNEYNKYRLFAENDVMQVLTLPYKDPSYALSILLPKKRFALDAIRNKTSGAELQRLLNQVKSKLMTISVPKMKIETKLNLKKALISMGVTEMFTDSADLSGITKEPPLKVSDATHKALIEVDEDGTTAATASVSTMVRISGMIFPENPISFIANHPFMFVLTRNTRPLFIGQFVA